MNQPETGNLFVPCSLACCVTARSLLLFWCLSVSSLGPRVAPFAVSFLSFSYLPVQLGQTSPSVHLRPLRAEYKFSCQISSICCADRRVCCQCPQGFALHCRICRRACACASASAHFHSIGSFVCCLHALFLLCFPDSSACAALSCLLLFCFVCFALWAHVEL